MIGQERSMPLHLLLRIETSREQIEHSLHILGVTALEDKLQEGVPDAIDTLHKAGIKLWILTGKRGFFVIASYTQCENR